MKAVLDLSAVILVSKDGPIDEARDDQGQWTSGAGSTGTLRRTQAEGRTLPGADTGVGRWSTDGVFTDHLGIGRAEMPQIRKHILDPFLRFAERGGVTITEERVPTTALNATQRAFEPSRVQFTEKKLNATIFISSDNRVLDGTHRWVAAVQRGKRYMNVRRIGLKGKDAINFMLAFPQTERGAAVGTDHVTARKGAPDPDGPRFEGDTAVERDHPELHEYDDVILPPSKEVGKDGPIDEARDERGRWTVGGSTGTVKPEPSGGRVGSGWLDITGKPVDVASLPPDQQALLAQYDTPEIRAARAEARAYAAANPGWDPTQGVTAERAATHVRLLNEVRAAQIAQYGEPSRDKIVDIVLGGAGAGKSSAVAEPAAAFFHASMPDPDLYKPKLDGYHGGVGAGVVHEESSYLADLQMLNSVALGEHIVLPQTGKTAARIAENIKLFHDAGYEVRLHSVEVPVSEQVRRTVARWKMPGGRFTDPLYTIVAVDNKPAKTIALTRGMVSTYVHYDNNVEFGTAPILRQTHGLTSSSAARRRLSYGVRGARRSGAQSPSLRAFLAHQGYRQFGVNKLRASLTSLAKDQPGLGDVHQGTIPKRARPSVRRRVWTFTRRKP